MRGQSKGLAFLLVLLLCAGLVCPRAMASAEPEAAAAEEAAAADTAEPDAPPAEETGVSEELKSPEEELPAGETAPREATAGPASAAEDESPPEEEPVCSDEPEETLRLDGAAVSNAFPFTDVRSGAWYYESVSYVYFNRLMNGVGGNAFRPEGTTTRAMVVTVLWRMAGSPLPEDTCAFTDLTQSWYRSAVVWAWNEGVAKGVTDTEFRPDEPVTREQMAAFIARYAAYVDGLDTGSGGDLSGFPDNSAVSAYARPAMAWASAAGLIQGSASGGTVVLAPRGSATRAQVAAILMRYRQRFARVGTGTAALVAASRTAGRTNQILTVVDHDLTFWERGDDGTWRKVLSAYAGYGANGLSADRREGDRTTPIGAFPLLYAFGRDDNPGTDMTYRRITPNSYFSAASDGTYNTWVESSRAVTGEHLADYADLQYRWGIVIGFNTDPVTVGRGSAIFLHCKGSSWSTAGCVSVERSVMTDILDKVNDGAWIIIVKNTQDLKNY